MPRSLTALAALLFLTLSACGFQPVFGTRSPSNTNSSVTNDLASIKIAPIADRVGQLLRNSLQDKLTPRGVPARALYRLDVSLTENRSDLLILKDSTSTFSKVQFIANFTLVDLANGQPVKTGQTESTTTFNRVKSNFAVLEAQKDARRRAADEISSDIRLRLGLYFNRIRSN